MFAKISSVLHRVENHTNTESGLFKWLLPMILVIAGAYNWFSPIGWGSTVGIITVSLLTFVVAKENRLTHMGQLGVAYGAGWLTLNVAAPLVLLDGWLRPIIAVIAAFFLSRWLSNWMDHLLKYVGVATSLVCVIMLVYPLFSIVYQLFSAVDPGHISIFMNLVLGAAILIYVVRSKKSTATNAAPTAKAPVTKAAPAATAAPVAKAAPAAKGRRSRNRTHGGSTTR